MFHLAGLVLLACAPVDAPDDDVTTPVDLAPISDISLAPAARVPTVVEVTWHTPTPTTGRVLFGEGDSLDRATAWSTEAATSHRALLVGLPELVAGSARIETLDADWQLGTSEALAFQTGQLAAELPRPTEVARDEARLHGGYTLVPLRREVPLGQWATLLDDRGRVVWAVEVSDTGHRLRLRADGGGLTTMDMTTAPGSLVLTEVAWDGTAERELVVPGGFQDFDVIDEDTYVVLTQGRRDVAFTDGDAEVLADGIIEFDRDGTVREVLDLFELLPPDEGGPTPSLPIVEDALEWAHTNFLEHDPHADELLVTMKLLDVALAAHRPSGEVRWILGQDHGDFEVLGKEPVLVAPHSVQSIDGGVLVFNHGDDRGTCAGATEVALDLSAGTAEAGWRSNGGGCFLMNYLGNAQRLDSGNTLVSYSHLGFMEELAPDGALVQRLEAPVGSFFLYAERVDELGGGL